MRTRQTIDTQMDMIYGKDSSERLARLQIELLLDIRELLSSRIVMNEGYLMEMQGETFDTKDRQEILNKIEKKR